MKITKAEFAGSSTRVSGKPARKAPEFAFIGRSNVGKSSLINMLTANSKLAKTSQTPGKTQLVNHFLINDSWYLVDLPGYGYAKLPDKERMQEVDLRFISELGEKGIPFGIIFTKADKMGTEALQVQLNQNKGRLLEDWEELPPCFVSSSVKGQGKEDILNYIGSILQTL